MARGICNLTIIFGKQLHSSILINWSTFFASMKLPEADFGKQLSRMPMLPYGDGSGGSGYQVFHSIA